MKKQFLDLGAVCFAAGLVYIVLAASVSAQRETSQSGGVPLARTVQRQREEDLTQQGRSLLLEGKLTEAEQKLRAALSLDNRLPLTWYALGQVLEQQKRFPEAVAAYRAAIYPHQDYGSSLTNDPFALYRLGSLCERSGLKKEAYEVFSRLIEGKRLGSAYPILSAQNQSPAEISVLARVALGMENYKRGKYQAAAAAYQEAIKLQPASVSAHFYNGILLKRLGQQNEAKKELELVTETGDGEIKAAAQNALKQP